MATRTNQTNSAVVINAADLVSVTAAFKAASFKPYKSTKENDVSLEVIQLGGEAVGVVNFSGVHKFKVTEIMSQWNAGQINSILVPNSYGNKKGYLILSSKGVQVGFLNLYGDSSLVDMDTV